MNNNNETIVISGIGITSAIAQGKDNFATALLNGDHRFAVMQRDGRQGSVESMESSYLGAEIIELIFNDSIPKRTIRSSSYTGQVALQTLAEAWQDANLSAVDPYRIGLVVGGSNTQQRELVATVEKYQNKSQYVPPNHALKFMDSDICGVLTETFGIKGIAYTIGGASASGQLAIIQAIQAVQSNQVDVCIALGALMDLSYLECQAFRSLGAMGSDHFATQPELACRPFDKQRNGFIYGESCGAVVIERLDRAQRSRVSHYARPTGWSIAIDGNRNPNPSAEGEKRAIYKSLEMAGLSAAQIDYINPHGTGSHIGDEIELQALKEIGLNEASINATKSIIGHGLSSAGTVELIACLLQMREGQLHPTRNLLAPIDNDFNWVLQTARSETINNALCLSYGFGGINTAISLSSI
jgi:malonyl-[acp] decarboxylase